MATDAYGAAADHAALSGLTAGDPHTQYGFDAQGLLSARPAQPVRAGYRYYATDAQETYRSDGSAWWQIGHTARYRYARYFLFSGGS